MQNSSLKQVSFRVGCSDLWFFLETQRARYWRCRTPA
jgi:hypothetical protein